MSKANANEMHIRATRGRYDHWLNVHEYQKESDASGESDTVEKGISLKFEAKCRGDLRIGFATDIASPASLIPSSFPENDTNATDTAKMAENDRKASKKEKKKSMEWMFEVAIGSSGNTEVVWRRNTTTQLRKMRIHEEELSNVFTGRTCSETVFVPYWIVWMHRTFVLGIGKDIGVDPIAKAVVDEACDPLAYVSFAAWDVPATCRNVELCDTHETSIQVDEMKIRTIIRSDPFGEEDLLTESQRKAYEEAVETARKRAERFGVAHKAPNLKDFVDPKDIRKWQRSGTVATDSVFATGFDLSSQDELNKRTERMKRFGTPAFAVEFSTDSARAISKGMTQEEWQEENNNKERMAARAEKFGLTQAENDNQSLHAASQKVASERCDISEKALKEELFRDDGIHVYSLDERFQQVRSKDVLSYFTGYGPSYVEWINDSSCTVVFQDVFTAKRALIALGHEITQAQMSAFQKDSERSDTEAQDVEMKDVTDSIEASTDPVDGFARSNWRLGVPMSKYQSDSKWRVLLRRATEDDFPPEKKTKAYHSRNVSTHNDDRGSRGRPSIDNSRSNRSKRARNDASKSLPKRYRR
uniref:Uncharacterized protein AlNc14C138G7163 n=1 Tax=Albugo laibachii Nc14 TaxID=890382 RepID=F0WKX3_9STRA|nr:conserved hypothetical protein [Albugo laibachii Nc14]CCA24782.1 conserved hypothetical protein [Albugo laibachii Nc14]|eukprot:CCA24782.1 conserved hypothetical protein [Albugo laibachii Nc14]